MQFIIGEEPIDQASRMAIEGPDPKDFNYMQAYTEWRLKHNNFNIMYCEILIHSIKIVYILYCKLKKCLSIEF